MQKGSEPHGIGIKNTNEGPGFLDLVPTFSKFNMNSFVVRHPPVLAANSSCDSGYDWELTQSKVTYT